MGPLDGDGDTEPRTNALQALYGSGDPERDRKRRNTAKSMISPPEGGAQREQTIYTPQSVLDVAKEVWPEGITLDPCHGPLSIVNAGKTYDGSPGQDGLALPWSERTFVNSPYKDLKVWLAKAQAEADLGCEVIVLCPVRTHRIWFRHAMQSCTAISYMDPLKFLGYAAAFPAPLCLMYWGERKEGFQKASRRVSKP